MSPTPYTLTGPCTRPAGKFILRPHRRGDGFKGRADYLADNLATEPHRGAGFRDAVRGRLHRRHAL